MTTIDLNGAWKLTCLGVNKAYSALEDVYRCEPPSDVPLNEIEATVPGLIHLDLLRKNIIADPYKGYNESGITFAGIPFYTIYIIFSFSSTVDPAL